MRKDIPQAERTYLAVPYTERHEAKAVGARWDAVKKAWYVGPEADREKIAKWEPQHQPAPTLDPQKYLTAGTKSISLEEFRKVLGLESVKDADGNIIQEAPLPVWANFRQRALDVAITEINKKTDLNIEIESLEQAKHWRVTT